MRTMPKSTEIRELANLITKSNDGKVFFNITEICRITGYGENTVPRMLHEHGILVKKDGKSKKVNVFDIAEMMCSKRTSPV